jgi:signal peptidase II
VLWADGKKIDAVDTDVDRPPLKTRMSSWRGTSILLTSALSTSKCGIPNTVFRPLPFTAIAFYLKQISCHGKIKQQICKIGVGQLQFLLVVLVLFILDQGIKWLVIRYMELGQSIPLLDNIFHLTYVQNPGAAFGMLPYKTTFFIVVTVLVVGGIALYYRKIPPDRRWLKAGLVLQAGGALGNLADRVRFGQVVDYLDFRVWPVFNLADIAIVTGVGLLILEMFKGDDPQHTKTEGEGE